MKHRLLLFSTCLLPLLSSGQTPTLQSFPISAVHLLESPFQQAQQTDKTYMLALNPDRLLAPYQTEAGIQ